MRNPPHTRLMRSLEACTVAMGAIGVHLRLIDHPPRYDEMYHVLAAISWAKDGTLSIAEGQYTRASLFTKLVGLLFRFVGAEIEVARLIAAVSGGLLIAAVFVWSRAHIGRAEAWIAAFLLTFSMSSLTLATMVRFYSLHALLFFLGAIVVYSLVNGRDRQYSVRVLQAVLAMLLFAVCLHLQITTAIGLAAISLWIGARVLPLVLRSARSSTRYRLALLSVGVLMAVPAAVFLQSDVLSSLWATYQNQAFWARGSSVLTYHWWLQNSYPVFYGLLPGVILLAISRHPGPGMFCIVVFFSGMIAHSFGGMRNEHYVFYLLPFFVIACSIAVVQVLPLMQSLARTVSTSLVTGASMGRFQALIGGGATFVTLLFLIASTPGLYRTIKVFLDGPASMHPQYRVDWSVASHDLSREAETADAVVTTNSLSALYFLDRYDVEMSATILHETASGAEFDLDTRTGRPVISSAASLQLLISCFQTGLVIVEAWQWGSEVYGVNDETIALLHAAASPINLPSDSQLIAYRWNNPAAVTGPQCPALASLRGAS